MKKTLKLRIFDILYSLICKSQESSFAQLKYRSLFFRVLAHFAGGDLQKRVVWFKAAKNGDNERISQIYGNFENKADIDITDEEGNTALDIAVTYGYIDTVEILIKAGANLNSQDKNGNIPLNLDLEKKNESAISLLKKPADDRDDSDIVSQDKAQALVNDEHANAELKESLGSKTQVTKSEKLKSLDTDCRIALSKGDFEKAKRLVEFGTNIISKDKNHYTALHKAIFDGDLSMIQKLIDLRVDLNVMDSNKTPLFHYVVSCGRLDIIEQFLKVGVNLEMRDKDGKTALHIASSERNVEAVKKLLCYATKLKDIKKFLEAKNKYGNTALHIAALNAETEMIRELKKSGADLEAKDDQDNTALHLAIFKGYSKTAEELIELGTRLDVKNKRNITPLSAAKHLKRDDITSLLEKAINDQKKQLVIEQDSVSLTLPSNSLRLETNQASVETQRTET